MAAIAVLKAMLGLDSTAFKAGVDGAKRQIQGFQSVLSGVAAKLSVAFSVGAVAAFAKSTISYLGGIADAADNLGVSTDTLQAFDYAAKATGNTLEDISRSLAKVVAAQGGAFSGKIADALRALSVDAVKFAAAKPEDALVMLGSALREAGGSQESMNAAMDIFGERVGPKLLALLRDIGGQPLDDLIAKTREAGAVVDAETVRMADAWDDYIQKLKMVVKAQAGIVMGGPPTARVSSPTTEWEYRQQAAQFLAMQGRKRPFLSGTKAGKEYEQDIQTTMEAFKAADAQNARIHSESVTRQKQADTAAREDTARERQATETAKASPGEKLAEETEKRRQVAFDIAVKETVAGEKERMHAFERAQEQRGRLEAQVIAWTPNIGEVNGDVMARVGGAIGGQADPGARAAERIEQYVREMVPLLQRLAQLQEEANELS